MMLLIMILFYIKSFFIKLYKKNFVFMTINNSNTLYNNYTLSGRDNRYPMYEKKTKMINNIYKFNIKKYVLDILENNNISINDKILLLQKHDLLNDSKDIKTIDLTAGNLMKNYNYDYDYDYNLGFDYDFDIF